MSGDEGGLVAHRPEPSGDRADELLLVAAREIPAPDRALEQHVADHRELRFRMVEDDVAGRVARAVSDVERQLAEAYLIALVEPARRLEGTSGDPVFRTFGAELVDPEAIVL